MEREAASVAASLFFLCPGDRRVRIQPVASDSRNPSAARPNGDQPPVRAAEMVGAMSIATDLGTGQPLEHALRTAILTVRLGDLAGLTPQERIDGYYIALLHSIACTADAIEQTGRFGGDSAPRDTFAV